MFTRKTLFAAAATGMLAATLAAPAMAQPGPGGWHHGDDLLEGVTLTDSQKSQVHALMKAQHQSGLFQQMRAVHEQIDSAIYSTGTVTAATLQPLLEQEASLMQQAEAQHVTTALAIRNLLTPTQLATAASTHAQMRALHDQEHALMSQGRGAGPAVEPAD